MTEPTKEEIIQAINEWPVDDLAEGYSDATTDRVHNPASVASFFLRNVGKKDKVPLVYTTCNLF